MAISWELASRTGLQRVIGLFTQTWALPALDRSEEARALADHAVTGSRERRNPFWIVLALAGNGRAHIDTDADKASGASREALERAHRNHIVFFEAAVASDFARLEAVHGVWTTDWSYSTMPSTARIEPGVTDTLVVEFDSPSFTTGPHAWCRPTGIGHPPPAGPTS